jgi:hypothetical protein
MFYPHVKRETFVQQGMKIGYITDYFGKTIFEAGAPVSRHRALRLRGSVYDERRGHRNIA